MISITKTEMDLMIQKGILKHSKGNYGEALIVGTSKKHGKSKARWVVEKYYYQLYPHLKPKDEKQKVDK